MATMKPIGPTRKRENYDALFARAAKTYDNVAAMALLLLAKRQRDDGPITNPSLDIKIAKAMAVTEEEGAPSTLKNVLAVVDSWEHMILRPEELASGVRRLVASRLVLQSREKLVTTSRFKKMAPRKKDGSLLMGSAGARKWCKMILG
jgi:hypothetical protein